MKIIDLLNKIANGEEVPKEIRYEGKRYYYCEEDDLYKSFGIYKEFPSLYLKKINDEVEIIEDKKIEKLDLDKEERLKKVIITKQDYVLVDKINEIIDYLEEKENE